MQENIPNLKKALLYYKRLLYLIKDYWVKLLKGFSLGIIIGVIGMIAPYFTKLLIDKVYPTQNISLMHAIVLGIFIIGIANLFISSIQGYYTLFINSKLSNSLSLMFYNHLQHLKIRFFDEHRTGEILSRFGDINKSLSSINKIFQTIFVNGIYIVLVPPFLFFLQWKLAIVSLITIPFVILSISILGKFLRKYWKKASEAFAELNAFQFEMLTHIRTAKTMCLENFIYKENKKQLENAFTLQMKASGFSQILTIINGILNSLNTTLYTWLGWTYILTNEMTLGDYIAFSAYIGYLYGPIKQFVNLFSELQRSSISLHRTFEYLDEETEFSPNASFQENLITKNLIGKIELINVSFGYKTDFMVLKNINMEFKPNSINAIIGPSGSGKTSLIRLLVNLENSQEGKIYFDNINQTMIPIKTLRQQISVIWQEFSLFKGTIYDNLTIGLNNINKELVNKAINISQLSELIESLPNGLLTEVAEWGSTLSGGQKQRLAIARAIIRDTPIIIFDEATSNIDIETEENIYKNIFTTLNDKTIIFVTHRINSTILADKIFLLEDGVITAQGTHKELILKSSTYSKMFSYNEKL